ncbi:MAG: DNA ligase [Pseudomonadota bacterium]|nr:DNA ligase [Pseudomonadota bacterium]MDO7710626.1 DNA ligase [Pseudomonadota bacterium]
MIIKWMFKGLTASLICYSLLSHAQEPDVLLLKTYDESQDVTGWLMSEKLDGMRAIWDGNTLKSRQGNNIVAPQWFLDGLPPFEIDGELWTKRGDFENIISIVRKQTPDNRWQTIIYNIFEVPNQSGGLLARLAVLRNYLAEHSSAFVKIIPQKRVRSSSQLKSDLAKITALGAEGLVVRKPDMPYHSGRSDDDLKLKQYQDAECTVIAYKEGKGKYTRKTGSLQCQLLSGLAFYIGSGLSDQQRESPPNIGSVITFKYYGLTKNDIPRFPVFIRVRPTE